MTCTTPCHGHTHRQGRGCECDANATRAALYMHDGGHTFHRGVAFPIEREQDDEPIYAWEGVALSVWCVLLVIVVSLAAIVVGIASALGAYLPALHI